MADTAPLGWLMLLISALLSMCIIFTAQIERQKAMRRAWTIACRERVGLQSGIRIMMTLAMSSFTSSLFEQVEMPCLSNCVPGGTF